MRKIELSAGTIEFDILPRLKAGDSSCYADGSSR